MVLFWPIQQELDCINSSGLILGKIKFDGAKDEHIFFPANDLTTLTSIEESSIADRLSGLDSGKYLIPMQDDD
mgnify:CR=1 FL=1